MKKKIVPVLLIAYLALPGILMGQAEYKAPPPKSYTSTELHIDNQVEDLYGELYLPETADEKVPLVILTHGFGGTCAGGERYATRFADMGIATYCYDLRFASPNSRSNNDTTKLSPLTVQSDLQAIINASKTWDFVDTSNVFLMGYSLGGLTSAITSPENMDYIKAEILFYPAFVIQDAAAELYAMGDDMPETFEITGVTLGRDLVEATVNYDILFEDAVAKVDNEYFKSIQLAIDSVTGTEQKTVEVLKSVTEQVTIPQNKNIILDGGGYTYTGKVTNHGTLEVQNGTFNNTDVVINNDGGNLQIKADNVTMTGSALNCPTILNNNQGTAVVTAGTYFSETDHVAENINSTMELGGTVKMNGSDVIEQATQKAYPVVSNISGGNLKITGGEYKGVGNSVWNRENAGTLEITGGTFINESDTNCNINLDSTAKLTISGGSFTSKRRRNWK